MVIPEQEHFEEHEFRRHMPNPKPFRAWVAAQTLLLLGGDVATVCLEGTENMLTPLTECGSIVLLGAGMVATGLHYSTSIRKETDQTFPCIIQADPNLAELQTQTQNVSLAHPDF